MLIKRFAQGSHAVLKVLNFKTGCQDLEKVLRLAKRWINYWKSMEILNEEDIWRILAEFFWRQSNSLFMQCYELSFMFKNFKKLRQVVVLNFLNLVLKKYGKWFFKMCGNPVYFNNKPNANCVA